MCHGRCSQKQRQICSFSSALSSSPWLSVPKLKSVRPFITFMFISFSLNVACAFLNFYFLHCYKMIVELMKGCLLKMYPLLSNCFVVCVFVCVCSSCCSDDEWILMKHLHFWKKLKSSFEQSSGGCALNAFRCWQLRKNDTFQFILSHNVKLHLNKCTLFNCVCIKVDIFTVFLYS